MSENAQETGPADDQPRPEAPTDTTPRAYVPVSSVEATNIAGLAYKALTDFHLSVDGLETLNALFDALHRFADPQEVIAIEALRIEISAKFGLTPPEVCNLPLKTQALIQEWRERNQRERNQRQAAYEERSGTEGFYTTQPLGANRHSVGGLSTEAQVVAEGAAYLDEKLPDWIRYINLDTLDLGSPFQCILGQLSGKHPAALRGGYGTFLSQFGLSHSRAGQFGFNNNRYRLEWRQLIAGRLGE